MSRKANRLALIVLAVALNTCFVSRGIPEDTWSLDDVPLRELIPPSEETVEARSIKEMMSTKREDMKIGYGDAMKTIIKRFDAKYLRDVAVDDLFSKKWFEGYLDFLDGARYYFTEDDRRRLAKLYQNSLDDAAKRGDISPAFVIFNLYEKRIAQRVNAVSDWAWNEKVSFRGDEYIHRKRGKLPPPADQFELMDLWKKRAGYDLLVKVLQRDNSPGQRELGKLKLEVEKQTRRIFDTSISRDYDKIAGYFLKTLAQTYDADCSYYTAIEIENRNASSDGTLMGIGALLQINESGYPEVVSLVKGGPAEQSGKINPGDQIMGIALENSEQEWFGTAHRELAEVVSRVRGKEGTIVKMQLMSTRQESDSEVRVVEIERAKIQLQSGRPSAWLIPLEPEKSDSAKIGWIRVPSLQQGKNENDASTSKDVLALLKRLIKEKIAGVVLDLRGNSGGYITQSAELAGIFLGDKPYCQQMENGEITLLNCGTTKKPTWDGPLLIMTNYNSSGGAEMIAGCMQEHGRAVVVGAKHTYGRALGSRYFAIAEDNSPAGGYVKISQQPMYRLDGRPIQNIGVVPDIVLPHWDDPDEIGARFERNPVQLEEIKPVTFEKQNRDLPLDMLRATSSARILVSPDFESLEESNQRIAKRQRENRYLLNLQKQLDLKKERENRDEIFRQEKPVHSWWLNMATVDDPKLILTKDSDNAPKFYFHEHEVLAILRDWLLD